MSRLPTIRFRLLPWEYGIRNAFRRPWRSGLTTVAIAVVVLIVFVVVGFIRGLETSLATAGDASVALVYSLGMGESLEYSAVDANTAELLAASLSCVKRRDGTPCVSPELYLATRIGGDKTSQTTGLIRGVTPGVLSVRRSVGLLDGRWPGPGEILVGRLAPTKLGIRSEQLAIGRTLEFEGREWRVSGHFTAPGTVLEAELWCPLDDLQRTLKRQNISLVALALAQNADFSDLDFFCKRRQDLELQTSRETEYYESLNAHYRPVRMLAWMVVLLVAAAGVFAALNTMYAAVVGRVRELATLQAIGFARRAICLSLVQESTFLAAAGSLVATTLALTLVNGVAVRFTMGAFELRVDAVAVAIGCGIGLLLGLVGALPPAFRAMRLPIAVGVKEV